MKKNAPQEQRILRARARELARPPAAAPTEAMLEVLEFRLADEHYAVETRYVQEAYPLHDLTPLPGTPPFVLGIVNVRGRILPVLDLKKFFELPERGITDLHRIILVRNGDMELGLLADVVVGVRSVAQSSLQTSLPTLTGIRADYLRGITEQRLAVLDLAHILADPKIIVQDALDV
jgi:purine-binding chemotaxis protein CheW